VVKGLRARPVKPFGGGRRGCGGRGPYANAMMGRSGLEVPGGCAAECKTRHDGPMSWLRQQRTLKSVVEDAERRDLFGGKAECWSWRELMVGTIPRPVRKGSWG
jgi:hypothetical protein